MAMRDVRISVTISGLVCANRNPQLVFTRFEHGKHECSMLGIGVKSLGSPPGLQPTPCRLGLVYIELNLLAAGGSRGTRADQGVCPTSFGNSESWEN